MIHDHEEVGANEEEASNRGSTGCVSKLLSLFPPGGLLSTNFNICATVIGAGILSLPSSFNDAGILMSVAYLILVSLETIYTMRLLALLARKTDLYSMEELSDLFLHRIAGLALGVLRIIFCFGACVAYVISVGDVFQAFIDDSSNPPDFLDSDVGIKVLQSIFWVLFFLPVVIPREISSLRYVSAVGIFFMLMLIVVMVIHACQNGLQEDPKPETSLFATGNDALGAVGVFIFSFTNQFNAMDIYNEMSPKHKNITTYTLCAIVSILTCCGIYIIGGVFGYLDFGAKADTSLLNLYTPLSDPQFFVCYVGVLIKLIASYGLIMYGCRNSTYHLIGWNPYTVEFWKHCLAITAISFVSLICGLFIPNINTVFGFVGGFCGGAISFLYPAYLTMFSGNWGIKTVGIVNYFVTYLVLAAGVFAIVVGTASTIYGALPS